MGGFFRRRGFRARVVNNELYGIVLEEQGVPFVADADTRSRQGLGKFQRETIGFGAGIDVCLGGYSCSYI